jgi:hypothetical protein
MKYKLRDWWLVSLQIRNTLVLMVPLKVKQSTQCLSNKMV